LVIQFIFIGIGRDTIYLVFKSAESGKMKKVVGVSHQQQQLTLLEKEEVELNTTKTSHI
jgi:hypothetical protein